ncbi:hypothetical protein [Jiangella alba]|uniref:Uncharacterized protein n=1 Tax=Jiangella alba TaxID=561176 RepID=A0A1H5MR33_9ACTN|nr:hypothetical protein [Jiangella alba]SEE91197.1 hypothetical protein SAMN04488561_3318 [Jiangella alba]
MTEASPSTTNTPRVGESAPLTHGICMRCWPVALDPKTIAMCGMPAWPEGARPHLCDYPAFACGCVPCVVCTEFQGAACPTCGNRGRAL